MRIKSILTSMLAVAFFFTTMVPAFANTDTAMEKVTELEEILYGIEQTGPLIERTNNLEEEIMGTVTNEAVLTRIDRLRDYIKGSYGSSTVSFLTKLNAVEWSFTEELSEEPVKSRLENIEIFLNGQISNGSISSRIDSLMYIAFNQRELNLQQVVLPKDLLIKVSIAQPLNSKVDQKGDTVLFKAEDNIYVGNVLVIPKGSIGHGVISKVSRARNFGRNGTIRIEYTDILTIDNGEALVEVGKLSEEATKSMAKAAGASMAGMVILGPVGIIGGVFIKGKEYDVPVGALLYVQIKEDTFVNGVEIPNMKIISDDDVVSVYAEGGL